MSQISSVESVGNWVESTIGAVPVPQPTILPLLCTNQAPSSGISSAVRLVYNVTDRVTGEKQYLDYQIPLTSTPCAYGGRRYWFVCPWDTDGQHCGRRVGTLYLLGDRFACRHCNNLTYASRNAPPYDKGFVSIPDIERQKDRVKRTHYAGRLTKQYIRLLLMEERFAKGMQALARALGVELPT